MDTAETTIQFELADPEILVKIKKFPSIKILFLKVFFLSMVRPSTLDDDTILSKVKLVFNDLKPDAKEILGYKRVCGFADPRKIDSNKISLYDIDPDSTNIPASYLQTLFIEILGKFITTDHFPIRPMGLIQVGQSFEQKRAVTTDERLDLSCKLHGVTKSLKGVHTQFLLEVVSDKEVVWQGISTFFTRSKNKQPKKKVAKKEEQFLETKESIFVPRNTGLKYANVSGDYNPHHLYGFTAKMVGFKQPIAHGMWSLARVMASMEKKFGTHYPLRADAAFKLPIFMPATISLGYGPAKTIDNRPNETRIDFELRDEKKGLPHLKGQFAFNIKG